MPKYPIPFGRHLLLERINVGGMAEVFKSKSFGVEGFERVVAVKKILPTLAEDDEFITMFIDEARIAAHLTHQNIVQIYELGKHDDNFFISMEYVAGRDLRQILDHQKKQKKPMEVAKACFIISKVCEALEYAHRKKDPAGKDLKIIHRDVTPQNVIISYEGEVKLCDFGIAKAASRASRTQVGVLKGKFAYMSPEQVRGKPTDRRSDLFALGVIFYEMITGERLFLGDSDYATLEAVRQARIPPPTRFNDKISPELEACLLKLLTRDPKDRYQWASEAHEDLLDHLIHEGKVYHSRHLRTWVRDVYAREIEIENAKLEEFMRLKLQGQKSKARPESPPVVFEVGEGAHEDPANATYSPEAPLKAVTPAPENEPTSPASDRDGIPTHPIELQTSEEPVPVVDKQAAGPKPAHSPVANLFGAPQLNEPEDSHGSGPMQNVMVVPADGAKKSNPQGQVLEPIEEIDSEEGERTQFDMELDQVSYTDGEETLFDEQDETVSGGAGLAAEIYQAQSELIQRLDQVGVLDSEDTGDTVDATEDVELLVAPQVLSVSDEMSATALGDDDGLGDMSDETSVSPVSIPEVRISQIEPQVSDRTTPGEMEFVEADALADATDAILEQPGLNEERNDSTTSAGPMLDSDDFPDSAADATGETPFIEPAPFPNGQKGQGPNLGGPRATGRAPQGKITKSAMSSAPRGRIDSPGFVDAPSTGRGPAPVIPGGVSVREVNSAIAQAPRIGVENPPRAAATVPLGQDPPPAVAFSPAAQRPAGFSRRARDPVVLILIAAAIGLISVSVLAFALLSGDSSQTTASLQILTEPIQNVEVRFDGKVVGTQTPITIPNLGLGMHTVELSAQGHLPYTQKIQISQAKPHTMVVPLEKVSLPEGEAPAPGLVPGVAPKQGALEAPEPKAPTAPEATLERAQAPPGPPPSAPPPKRRRAAKGYLKVVSRPPGVAVSIDGKPTGMLTPIRKPLTVKAGRHVVTFMMSDGKTYDFSVNVLPGQTTKFAQRLR